MQSFSQNMSFLFKPSNALAPYNVWSLNQQYMICPQHNMHPKDIYKFLIMSLLSKVCQLLPVLLQQFISSLFLSQRNYNFCTLLSLTLLQFLCLLPLGLFSSNLSITEILVLLLSTCPAITAWSSWFLNPGSSYTTFSRTVYQISARISGLHQAIFYVCQLSWHFKYISSLSCVLLVKGNLMPPLISQLGKMDCLQ